MVQRSAPAAFLMKTYSMVDDPTTDEIISWNERGDGFLVWKTVDFARELLPNSFKHNNFSSFIRQLNTYGFHKTLPDKWEFANDHFKRGRQELLIQIHRRKTATSAKGKSDPEVDGGSASPPSNSGYDLGSTSTSSPDSKNPGSVVLPTAEKLENLSDENEKLKNENKFLMTELAQAKKQCDDLVVFLTHCVKMSPDEISRIVSGDVVVGETATVGHEMGGDVSDDDTDGDCFRLFGVLLKDGKKKRGCVDKIETLGSQTKKMKVQGRVGYIR